MRTHGSDGEPLISAEQVAQEAYSIWRGSHYKRKPTDIFPPHWDELDGPQRDLLRFVVLHVAAQALSEENSGGG